MPIQMEFCGVIPNWGGFFLQALLLLRTPHSPLSTLDLHCPLSTLHFTLHCTCPLSTVHCPLSTVTALSTHHSPHSPLSALSTQLTILGSTLHSPPHSTHHSRTLHSPALYSTLTTLTATGWVVRPPGSVQKPDNIDGVIKLYHQFIASIWPSIYSQKPSMSHILIKPSI